MDYFDSISLSEHVRKHGPLAAVELLPLAKVIAEALQVAHTQGILHRDVKPDNVLVRRDATGAWKVKVIDFGLAVSQELMEATIRPPETPLGEYAIAGTIDYAAPEQMGRLSSGSVGSWSDVYGFARTCYFALLGTPAPDDLERELLDQRWRKLLGQCAARKIENRIKTFTEVLERLRELESQVSATRPILKVPTPSTARPTVPPPPPRQPGRVPPRYIERPAVPLSTSHPVGVLFEQPLSQGVPAAENEATGEQSCSGADQPKKGPLGAAFG
jgi:serine/threonine protein kinase